MTERVSEIETVLKGRNLKLVSRIDKDSYPFVIYCVIWKQKDKVKYGHIPQFYHHRYGIDVLSTYNGRRFWFKSNDIADSILDDHLEFMETEGDGLPDFDTSLLLQIEY